jgi:hypothetical protein
MEHHGQKHRGILECTQGVRILAHEIEPMSVRQIVGDAAGSQGDSPLDAIEGDGAGDLVIVANFLALAEPTSRMASKASFFTSAEVSVFASASPRGWRLTGMPGNACGIAMIVLS